MGPKETLEKIYNLICSIAVQELGLKIDHEYALIPMSSPIVDYPVDYELQEKYKREYPLIYQTIQDCLVEDCILKEKQSYGQKTFLYCRQFYEVEAEEGLKEAQRLKEEKHSDEEWKKIFYSVFGMRYNLDYYELSSEGMLLQIENWFKDRLEDFDVMRKHSGSAWDREKMKPNRRKIDTRISSRSVESQ